MSKRKYIRLVVITILTVFLLNNFIFNYYIIKIPSSLLFTIDIEHYMVNPDDQYPKFIILNPLKIGKIYDKINKFTKNKFDEYFNDNYSKMTDLSKEYYYKIKDMILSNKYSVVSVKCSRISQLDKSTFLSLKLLKNSNCFYTEPEKKEKYVLFFLIETKFSQYTMVFIYDDENEEIIGFY